MSYAAYQEWKTNLLETAPYLSVVIPTYHAEAHIVPTIGAIASHICDMGIPWELIVADDASGSDTVKMIATLGLVNLRLLVSPKTYGKGRSVQRGILSARGRYILLTEANNSTPIEELNKLMVKVERGGYPIAIGSRVITDARVSRSLPDRLLGSQPLRWLLRRSYHIDVQDTRCGFGLFSRRAAHQLFSAQTLTGFAFDLEILFLAQKFGFPIAEVPVNWVDSPGSKLNVFKEAPGLLHDLARIKINDWRGVYSAQTMIQPDLA